MSEGKAMNIETALADALAELRTAQSMLELAEQESARAATEETACLNRVNAAQKRIGQLLGEIKETAPSRSDWAREHRQTRIGNGTLPR